jgi:hypothetical protein
MWYRQGKGTFDRVHVVFDADHYSTGIMFSVFWDSQPPGKQAKESDQQHAEQ